MNIEKARQQMIFWVTCGNFGRLDPCRRKSLAMVSHSMVFPQYGLAGSVEKVDTRSSNHDFQHGFPPLVTRMKPATIDDRWLGLCLGSTAGAVLLVLCPFHMRTCL